LATRSSIYRGTAYSHSEAGVSSLSCEYTDDPLDFTERASSSFTSSSHASSSPAFAFVANRSSPTVQLTGQTFCDSSAFVDLDLDNAVYRSWHGKSAGIFLIDGYTTFPLGDNGDGTAETILNDLSVDELNDSSIEELNDLSVDDSEQRGVRKAGAGQQ
jgi:hypothetical protein